jgi:hypothetical protein
MQSRQPPDGARRLPRSTQGQENCRHDDNDLKVNKNKITQLNVHGDAPGQHETIY